MSEKEASPELFTDAPDKTAEALATFTNLTECTYLAKNLGRSGQKETMTCDCLEAWDEESGANLACGDDSNCINRVTSVECTNKGSMCGADCQNHRFQKQQYGAVKVVQTAKKGYGLVARECLPEQLFIYEYIGEVIGEDEFRRRMVAYDQRSMRHFYFMMLAKDAFIDATEKGCLARFCNHSCLPNAYVDKWVVGDRLRMGIFAKRAIAAGEEITFDYNVDRYGAQLQACFCGTPACIGWMGGKTQTDAALLLPEGVLEALGVTKQQERAWLKQNKKARNLPGSEAAVNEEFVKSIEVIALSDAEVARAMSTLMKAEEATVVEKLVERVYLTDEPRTNLLIVKFHGYKTLSRVLRENAQNDDLVVRILLTLARWPSMTRNKIELSQIEAVVRGLVAEAQPRSAEIVALGQRLLKEWSTLEMAYRIPKNEAGARSEDKGISPDYGRNPRSALPHAAATEAAAANPADPTAAEQAADDLPFGWQRALDPLTNTYYYYHKGMGVSKWERPTNAIPTGPKLAKKDKPAKKEESERSERTEKERNDKDKKERKYDGHRAHEELLRKQKQAQFNDVVQKEKALQALIVQSQRDAADKRRAEEQARAERMAKIKERQRKREAAAVASAARDKPQHVLVLLSLWTNTLARYVPNLIKKHERDIGHDNVKGCARELVKVLAQKELKKDAKSAPPAELDGAKVKKLREFCDSWMEKFLVKYRTKRHRPSEEAAEKADEKAG